MHDDKRDFQDPRLSAALRAALGREQAPDTWVQDALAIGRPRGVERPLPRTAAPSILREIFPHLCGALVLAGAVVGLLLQPHIAADLWRALKGAGTPTGSLPLGLEIAGATPAIVLGSLLVPAVLSLIAVEASRGFADLRRWLN